MFLMMAPCNVFMTNKEYAIFKKSLPKLKRSLSAIARALTGKTIYVNESQDPNAIGYTSEKREICISSKNEFLDMLSLQESIKFYRGVFCHELLHQLLTNFKLIHTIEQKYERSERSIIQYIHNVVEDPRIEYFSKDRIGGSLIDDLIFSKVVIYRNSPKLEESKYPFQQFMNACIQYGDCGILRGNFTYPEARDTFLKAIPVFDKAIEEPSCNKAFNLALQIAEIARPLWQSEADLNKMLDDIMSESLKNSGHNPNTSPLMPIGKNDGQNSPNNNSVSKNRKITKMKVTKEQADELLKNSSSGNGGDADEIVVLEIEDGNSPENGKSVTSKDNLSEDKNENGSDASENSSASSGTKSEDTDSSENGAGKSTENSDENGASSEESLGNEASGNDESDNSQSTNGDSTKDDASSESESESDESSQPRNSSDQSGMDKNNSDESKLPEYTNNKVDIDELESQIHSAESEIEDYHISDDEISQIDAEIDRYISGSNEIRDDEVDETKPLDIPNISSKYFKNASVLNRNMIASESAQTEYDKLKVKLNDSITLITRQFQRFFKNKVEEREYCTSGKVNIKRINSARVTSRVFERKRCPSNRFDFAIGLAIDESGSMSGENCRYAQLAAIMLAEVCNNLDIPLYVMGFTTGGYGIGNRNVDAVHNHYIKWKNNKAARRNLVGISSYNCNFDGYTVRYMDKLLQTRSEKNKIMIVISDGTPSANAYSGYNNTGIADTKAAIKDANKTSTVLGVAIGSADKDALHEMYGMNFLYVPNVSELSKQLSRKLFNIIKEI